MREELRATLLTAAAALILVGSPAADEAPGAPEPPESMSAAPIYRPPPRGAERARVGAGARGTHELATPLALAPEHVGLTVAPYPSLFWFVDRLPPPSTLLILTLSGGDGLEPLAEVIVPEPLRPGIQRISLRRHAIELRPGVEYTWSVSLVRDPDRRSLDLVSSGFIRRSSDPPRVEPRSPQRFAELGFWYDALEAAIDALDADPADDHAVRDRDALLEQVGLDPALEPHPLPETRGVD